MRVARRVDVPCPNCGEGGEVWMHEKREATVIKEQYTCQSCGRRWREVRQD